MPQIVKIENKKEREPPKVSLQQKHYIDIVSSKDVSEDEVESLTVSLKSPNQIEVGGQDVEKTNSKYEKSIYVSNMERNHNDRRFESEIENSPAPRLEMN